MSIPAPLPQTCQSEETRGNNFNVLRLVLAIAVIFSHSTELLLGPTHLDPVASALHNQFDQIGDHPVDSGHLAVYGFFVISGYLISMSFARSRSIGSYLKKRVLRIYPGFLVASLLCVVLFGPLGTANPHGYWVSLAHHPIGPTFAALKLDADFNAPPFVNTLTTVPFPRVINGSFWTIRYEFMCYLMVVALGVIAPALFRRFPAARRAAPLAFFLLFYVFYVGNIYGYFLGWTGLLNHALVAKLLPFYLNIPRLFLYFIIGMCFYAYRRWVPYNTPLLLLALVVLVVSALRPPLLPLTLPIFGSYALLAIAFAPWLRLSRIGTKHDLSYGIYLYACPIQQLLVYYAGRRLTPTTEFLAALPITVLFAWLSWTLVEHPALRLKSVRNSPPPAELNPAA